MSKTMESRSKFACLRIDDDSDDEQPSYSAPKTGTANGKKPLANHRPANRQNDTNGGRLIVHAVEKKSKAKKANKPKTIDPRTGLVIQDADDNFAHDQQHKEELRAAMRDRDESSSPDDTSTAATVNPVHSALIEIDKEASRHGSSVEAGGASAILVALYKSKITELMTEAVNASNEAEQAKADVEKYRGRYKKIVELLRDAEVNEKAKLVMELEKVRVSESELAMQLVFTQKELDKARSRISQLEGKK